MKQLQYNNIALTEKVQSEQKEHEIALTEKDKSYTKLAYDTVLNSSCLFISLFFFSYFFRTIASIKFCGNSSAS